MYPLGSSYGGQPLAAGTMGAGRAVPRPQAQGLPSTEAALPAPGSDSDLTLSLCGERITWRFRLGSQRCC